MFFSFSKISLLEVYRTVYPVFRFKDGVSLQLSELLRSLYKCCPSLRELNSKLFEGGLEPRRQGNFSQNCSVYSKRWKSDAQNDINLWHFEKIEDPP